MAKLRFIATGTGRCGTVFMARYLTSVGLKCGHECFFTRDGIDQAAARLADPLLVRGSIVSGSAWLDPGDGLAAESSYMAAPFLDTPLLEGASVIHLVRNPLKVLSSFVTGLGYFRDPTRLDTYEGFIFKQIPSLYQAIHQLERGCRFVVEWHRLIHAKASGKPYLLHRIEDDPTPVWEFVGRPNYDPLRVFGDTTANSFPKRMIRLGEIPNGADKDAFVAYAATLGYSLQSRLFA